MQHMPTRNPGADTDWGHAELIGTEPFRAGERASWEIRYRAGERGIVAGGGLRIIPPTSGTLLWDVGKVLAVTDQPGLVLEVHGDKTWPRTYHHSNYPAVQIVLYGGNLRPDAEIRVLFGCLGGYNSGRFLRGRVQDMAGEADFQVFVDPMGNGRFSLEKQRPDAYKPVPGNLTAHVRPGRPDHLRISLRSPISGPAARIVVEDRYQNVCDEAALTVLRCGEENPLGFPGSISVHQRDGGRVTQALDSFPNDAPTRLCLASPEYSIAGTSNPVQPGFHGEWNAYFGDLHVMTGSCGNPAMLQSTEFALRYARDTMGLDFSAVTNSGGFSIWEKDAPVFRAFNAPGEFVSLPAVETGYKTGHKNIYFADEDIEAIPRHATLDELWRCAEANRALVISHHTNTHSETDRYECWSNHDLTTINTQFESVIEICQVRGSFEKDDIGAGVNFGGFGSSIQDALAMGFRLGFVGGTDTHRARPGLRRSHQSGLDTDDFPGGGLTCVLAKELTRDAVLDAIRNRRCYATMSVKVLLDVRLNGVMMGQDIPLNDDTREQLRRRQLQIKVAGTGKVSRVVVVRNNVDVYSVAPDSLDANVEWVDSEPLDCLLDPKHRSVFYYVRVVQEDGSMAWSSPIWIAEHR
jgi:hypothetical protein